MNRKYVKIDNSGIESIGKDKVIEVLQKAVQTKINTIDYLIDVRDRNIYKPEYLAELFKEKDYLIQAMSYVRNYLR